MGGGDYRWLSSTLSLGPYLGLTRPPAAVRRTLRAGSLRVGISPAGQGADLPVFVGRLTPQNLFPQEPSRSQLRPKLIFWDSYVPVWMKCEMCSKKLYCKVAPSLGGNGMRPHSNNHIIKALAVSVMPAPALGPNATPRGHRPHRVHADLRRHTRSNRPRLARQRRV